LTLVVPNTILGFIGQAPFSSTPAFSAHLGLLLIKSINN